MLLLSLKLNCLALIINFLLAFIVNLSNQPIPLYVILLTVKFILSLLGFNPFLYFKVCDA